MSNLFDYISWRGELPIGPVPFNDIDGLVLSMLSYITFEKALPEAEAPSPGKEEAALEKKLLPSETGSPLWEEGLPLASFWPRMQDQTVSGRASAEEDKRLFEAAAKSERFGPLKLCHYVQELDESQEMQFAAVTILLPDGTPFVSFRGTDLTLVGWKEDFNLVFSKPVPAQARAAEYLTKIVKEYPGPVRIGGHSKGGNLALYAAAAVEEEVQCHIGDVYVNDGPGLSEELFTSPGYERIRKRLHVFLPEQSVVGILLMHPEKYQVVKSDAVGMMQHNPYSWQVMGGKFVLADGLRKDRIYLEATMKKWLAETDEEQLRCFVDTLFQVFGATEATTFKELWPNILRRPKLLVTALQKVDAPTRQKISEAFGALMEAAVYEAEQAFEAEKPKKPVKPGWPGRPGKPDKTGKSG